MKLATFPSLSALALAAASTAGAQCELARLQPSDGGQGFGAAVAVSANLLVAGAPSESSVAMWSGAAYVFDLASGQEIVKLKASDASAQASFGVALAAHGDLLVVGASAEGGSGAVYLFDLATGTELAKIKNPLGQPSDLFGFAVATDGVQIVVGAPKDDALGRDAGAVFVYDANTMALLHTLQASNSTGPDFFGYSVAIAADRIAVGAPHNMQAGCFAGAAYLYDAASGKELQVLMDGHSILLGDAIDVSATHLVASSSYQCVSDEVFVFDAVNGALLQRLTEPHWDVCDEFGHSLALFGQVLLVGAPRDPVFDAGTVHAFDLGSGEALYSIRSADPLPDEGFGASLAGDGGRFVVGAAGSAYVFAGPAPVGSSACGPAVPNSSGQPATLTAIGSEVVTDGLFTLAARQLPQSKFGYFLASQTPGFVSNPGGSQGNLCLGGTIGRFVESIQKSGHFGALCVAVDLGAMPAPLPPVQSGQTWFFQAWFRDKNPGPTSNFTDSVSVVFQ